MILSYSFIDTASTEKERLEEKQRAARWERSQDKEEWSTRCVFKLQTVQGVFSTAFQIVFVRDICEDAFCCIHAMIESLI